MSLPETPTPPRFRPDMSAHDRLGIPVWRGGEPAASAESNDGSMLLYLGVFMLLLAFFILLNALSNFHDQKVGAVLRSVDEAFSVQAILTGAPGDRRSARREAARALADLGDLIRAELPLAKVDTSGEGSTLMVTLPASALFVGDGLAIRPDQQGLMDRMARALVASRPGIDVRAEALFGRQGATDMAPLVARAGALARSMTALGAPPAALSVGLEPTVPAGTVRLLYTVLVTDSPVGPAGDR